MIKENPVTWPGAGKTKGLSRKRMEEELRADETIWSIWLKEENLDGFLNFRRVIIFDTPLDQIEKALVSWRRIVETNHYHCK